MHFLGIKDKPTSLNRKSYSFDKKYDKSLNIIF